MGNSHARQVLNALRCQFAAEIIDVRGIESYDTKGSGIAVMKMRSGLTIYMLTNSPIVCEFKSPISDYRAVASDPFAAHRTEPMPYPAPTCTLSPSPPHLLLVVYWNRIWKSTHAGPVLALQTPAIGGLSSRTPSGKASTPWISW